VQHGAVAKAAAGPPHSTGEDKAKNNVCFLFAMVVVWASPFSTGERCAVFQAVF
jgi:hypothetical protein